jgi:hypothetical protein
VPDSHSSLSLKQSYLEKYMWLRKRPPVTACGLNCPISDSKAMGKPHGLEMFRRDWYDLSEEPETTSANRSSRKLKIEDHGGSRALQLQAPAPSVGLGKSNREQHDSGCSN